MPQLDFSTYASQLFWLAVTFSFLYFLIARVAWPQARDVLQNRQSRIASDLNKAQQLKEEAENAQQDSGSALADARRQASELLQEVRQNIAAKEAKHYAKLDEKLERQAKEAETRVETIRTEANDTLLPVVTEAAIEMCKKLVNVDIDKKQAEAVAVSLLKKEG